MSRITVATASDSGMMHPAIVLQSDLVTETGYPLTIVVRSTTRILSKTGIMRSVGAVLEGAEAVRHLSEAVNQTRSTAEMQSSQRYLTDSK